MDNSSVRGASFFVKNETSSTNISASHGDLQDRSQSGNSRHEGDSTSKKEDTDPSNQSISVLRAASFYNEQIASNAAANVVNNSISKLHHSNTENQSVSELDIRTVSFYLQGTKEVALRKLPSHRSSFLDSNYQNSILASMQEDAQSHVSTSSSRITVNRSNVRNQSSDNGTSSVESTLSQSASALNSSTESSTSNISQTSKDHPGSSLGSNSILSTSQHPNYSGSPSQNGNGDKLSHATTTQPIPSKQVSMEHSFLSARNNSVENQSNQIVHSPNRDSSIPKAASLSPNHPSLPNPSHFDTPDRLRTRDIHGRSSPGQIRSYYESASEGDDTSSPNRIESQIFEQRQHSSHRSNGSQDSASRQKSVKNPKQDEEDIMDLTSIHSDGAASDCQHDVSVDDTFTAMHMLKLNNHLQSLELSAIALEMSCITEDEPLCVIPPFRHGHSQMIDTADGTPYRNRSEFSGNALAHAICAADAAVTEIRKTEPSSVSHSSYDLNLMQIDGGPMSPVYYTEMSSPGGSTYVHSNVVGSTPIRSNYRQITAVAADADEAAILSSRMLAAKGRPKGALLHPSPRYFSPRLETADEREEDLHMTSVHQDTELSLGTPQARSLRHTSETRLSYSSSSNFSKSRQRNRKVKKPKKGSKRCKTRSSERKSVDTREKSFDSTFSGSSSGDLHESTAELSFEGLLHAFLDMISPEDERSLYTIDSESVDSQSADGRTTPSEARSSLGHSRQFKDEEEFGLSHIQKWFKKELVSVVVKDVSSTVYAAADESKDLSNVEELLNTEIQRVLSGEGVSLFGSKHNNELSQTHGHEHSDDPLNRPHLQWLKSLKKTLDEAQERTFVCSVPEKQDSENENKTVDAIDELAQAIRFANLSKRSKSAAMTPKLRSIYEKWNQASRSNAREDELSSRQSSSCADTYSKGVNLGDSLDLFTIDELAQPTQGENEHPVTTPSSQPVNQVHIKYRTPENSILDSVVDVSLSKSLPIKDTQTEVSNEVYKVEQDTTVNGKQNESEDIETSEPDIYSPSIADTTSSPACKSATFSNPSKSTELSGTERIKNVFERHDDIITEDRSVFETRNSFDQARLSKPTGKNSINVVQPLVSALTNSNFGETCITFETNGCLKQLANETGENSLSLALADSGEIEVADEEFSLAMDKSVPGVENINLVHQLDSIVHEATLSMGHGKNTDTKIDLYQNETREYKEETPSKLRFSGKHESDDIKNSSASNTRASFSNDIYALIPSNAQSTSVKPDFCTINTSSHDKSNSSKASSMSYDSIHEVKSSLQNNTAKKSKTPSLSNNLFHEVGFLPQDSTIFKNSFNDSSLFVSNVQVNVTTNQRSQEENKMVIMNPAVDQEAEPDALNSREDTILPSMRGEDDPLRFEPVINASAEAGIIEKPKTRKKKRRLPKIHILTNVQGGSIHNSEPGEETNQCHSNEKAPPRLGSETCKVEVSHECNLTQFGQEWTQDEMIERSVSREEPDSVSVGSQRDSSAENSTMEHALEWQTNVTFQVARADPANNDSGLTHFGQEWVCEVRKNYSNISGSEKSLEMDQIRNDGTKDRESNLVQSSPEFGQIESIQKSPILSAPSNMGLASFEMNRTGMNDSMLSNSESKTLIPSSRADKKKKSKSPHVLRRIGKINFMKKRLGYRIRSDNHAEVVVVNDFKRQQAADRVSDIDDRVSSISRRLFVNDDECTSMKNHEEWSDNHTNKAGKESMQDDRETKPQQIIKQLPDDPQTNTLKLRKSRSRHEIKVEKEKKSRKKRNTVESLLEIKEERFNFLSKQSKKVLNRQRSLPVRSAMDIFNDVLSRSRSDNPAAESDADLSLPFHNTSVDKLKQNETAETVKLSFNHSSEWEEFSTGFGGNIWDTSTSKSPAKRSYLPALPRTPEEFNTSEESNLYAGPVLI
jgi:hypothetical protein